MRLEKLEQLEEQTRAHSVFVCFCWFCNVLSLCCQRYVSWYHCRESLLTLFQTFGTAWVACRHSLELALFPVGIELTKRTSMDRHASCIQDLRSLELAEEGGWFFSGTDWIGLVHHHLTAYQQSNVTFATCFIVNWSWDFPWLASCHNWKQSVSNYTIQQSHTLLIIPLPTHTHMIISPRHGHRPAHHHHGHQH
jgi:hypothetical protein